MSDEVNEEKLDWLRRADPAIKLETTADALRELIKKVDGLEKRVAALEKK